MMMTFGEILREKGIVTEGLLKEALEKQRKNDSKLIGELLIELGIPHKVIFRELDLYRKRKYVGQLLLEEQKVTREQLDQALDKQKETNRPLLVTLMDMGAIEEEDSLEILSKHFNLPIISLSNFHASLSLQMAIGENFALKNKIIVLDDDLDGIKLALAEPSKPLINNLYHYLPRNKLLTIYLASYSEVEKQFENIYPYNRFVEYFPPASRGRLNISDDVFQGRDEFNGNGDLGEGITKDFTTGEAPIGISPAADAKLGESEGVQTLPKPDRSSSGDQKILQFSKLDNVQDAQDILLKLEVESDYEKEVVNNVYEIDGDSSAAAVKYLNKIIVQSHRMGASDIHFEPGGTNKNATIRMRVDGVCRKMSEVPEPYYRAMLSRIKIMTGMDIAERRKPQDGKAMVKYQGNELGLRSATMPTVNGESVVIRLLASGDVLSMEKLNLSERNFTEISKIMTHPHGIFLVVGPTGSGKTTTLHAILREINSVERKIWTAEDPVEITQPGLQQVQTNFKIGLTFANVLRSFLRLDPDVIFVGEMRDRETASIGIEASLTGHLVFSTLHTNSAPETIIRLLDLGVDSSSFAEALLGILAQRLVRTLCSTCKKHVHASLEDQGQIREILGEESYQKQIIEKSSLMLYEPVGCQKCMNTGYLGRIGIHELLVNSFVNKEYIVKKGSVDEIKKQAIAEGMETLIQDGIAKILAGHMDFFQLFKATAE